MKIMFILVVYDISSDKRRTKLHNKLKNYGNPVQYSVFECILEEKEIIAMKAVVERTVKPKLDHVRYYYMCNACCKRIEVIGRHEITKEITTVVV